MIGRMQDMLLRPVLRQLAARPTAPLQPAASRVCTDGDLRMAQNEGNKTAKAPADPVRVAGLSCHQPTCRTFPRAAGPPCTDRAPAPVTHGRARRRAGCPARWQTADAHTQASSPRRCGTPRGCCAEWHSDSCEQQALCIFGGAAGADTFILARTRV
eukprot:3732604-Prymnesium_polylepis.1